MPFSRRNLLLSSTTSLFGASASARNICDCHTHIFAPQFPFADARTYTPQPATPKQMLALQSRLGADRVVIVTPSVYGTDNRATAYGLRELGLKRARGIAVISPETQEPELRELHRQGFRGIRLNFSTTAAQPDTDAMRARLRRAVEQVRPLGWHIQIYTSLAAIAALEADLAPITVVLDHVCQASTLTQPGFDALLRLVRNGNAYVKLTHRFVQSAKDPAAIVHELVQAKADRMLWGTDWPHPNSTSGRKPTEVTPPEEVDDVAIFRQLREWMGKEERRILVENPARLYQFI